MICEGVNRVYSTHERVWPWERGCNQGREKGALTGAVTIVEGVVAAHLRHWQWVLGP